MKPSLKSRPEYLFKLDDDSYVNVETLWRLLDMNKIKQRGNQGGNWEKNEIIM